MAWVLVISGFSTGWFSGERTGYVFLPLLRFLLPWASLADLVALHGVVRKLAHFVEYLVLGILVYRALDESPGFGPRIALRALALCAALALVDEGHQYFVANRTAAWQDCLIDASGAAAGLGLLGMRRRSVTARAAARP